MRPSEKGLSGSQRFVVNPYGERLSRRLKGGIPLSPLGTSGTTASNNFMFKEEQAMPPNSESEGQLVTTTAAKNQDEVDMSSIALIPKVFSKTHIPIQEHDLSALYSLFHPPPELMGSVQLQSQHISLNWLIPPPRPAKSVETKFVITPPKKLLTLDNLPTDFFASQPLEACKSSSGGSDIGELIRDRKQLVLINSPRSTLTLFRNGVAVDQLMEQPLDAVEDEVRLEGKPLQVIEQRHKHRECRRLEVLRLLRQEYARFKEEISLSEIIGFFQAYHETMSVSPDGSGGATVDAGAAAAAATAGMDGSTNAAGQSMMISMVQVQSITGPGSWSVTGGNKTLSPMISPAKSHGSSAKGAAAGGGSSPPFGLVDAHQTSTDSISVGDLASPSRGVDESVYSGGQGSLSPTHSHGAMSFSAKSTNSKINRALGTLASVDKARLEWGCKMVNEVSSRIENQFTRSVANRQKLYELHRENVRDYFAAEQYASQRLQARKQAQVDLQKQKSEQARVDIIEHQALAESRKKELAQKKVEDVARLDAEDENRQKKLQEIRDRIRANLAHQSERRQNNFNRFKQNQTEVDDARVIHSVWLEKESRRHYASIQASRAEIRQTLRNFWASTNHRRVLVYQQAAVNEMARRLHAEDNCENVLEKSVTFMTLKRENELQSKHERSSEWDEEWNTVKQKSVDILEGRRQWAQAEIDKFDQKYQRNCQRRHKDLTTLGERNRLKGEDKQWIKIRNQYTRQYDRLCTIDHLHHKIRNVEKTLHSQKDIIAELKYTSEEKQRDKVRLFQIIKEKEITQDKLDTALNINANKA